MKLLLMLFPCALAFAADWDSVQRTAVSQQLEVTENNGTLVRGAFVSANGTALVLRDSTGERSIAQTEITKVRVRDPGRRVRRGVLWTLVGLGAGIGVGVAACPSCANEGFNAKYVPAGAAGGAGLGALGFLSSPYRTIYRRQR